MSATHRAVPGPGTLRSGSGPRPGPGDRVPREDGEGSHSRVVDNLEPLPFLEGQVGLCPRLIVIEGHKGGHSTCREGWHVSEWPGPQPQRGVDRRVSHNRHSPAQRRGHLSGAGPAVCPPVCVCLGSPVRVYGRRAHLFTRQCAHWALGDPACRLRLSAHLPRGPRSPSAWGGGMIWRVRGG